MAATDARLTPVQFARIDRFQRSVSSDEGPRLAGAGRSRGGPTRRVPPVLRRVAVSFRRRRCRATSAADQFVRRDVSTARRGSNIYSVTTADLRRTSWIIATSFTLGDLFGNLYRCRTFQTLPISKHRGLISK